MDPLPAPARGRRPRSAGRARGRGWSCHVVLAQGHDAHRHVVAPDIDAVHVLAQPRYLGKGADELRRLDKRRDPVEGARAVADDAPIWCLLEELARLDRIGHFASGASRSWSAVQTRSGDTRRSRITTTLASRN